MSIQGIDQVTYGVEDRSLCRQFFTDWGLSLISDSNESTIFESQNGSQVILADKEDPELPPAFEPGSTVREVVWGVDDKSDLERLKSAIRGLDTFVETDDRIGCTDPNGMAIRFQVSSKRSINIKGSPSNTWDRHERIDSRGVVYEKAAPIEIGHVVFFVSDIDLAEAFYQTLGFVTSDRYPDKAAFMRCTPRHGHHNLFMLQLPSGKVGLNHVAFTVRDIHEVFGGGMHISRCGWKTQLGPGRHPISSAYFWYFNNPAGALCEYYADEDQLTENWEPGEFQPGPTVFAEWAIAGGLDGNTRRQRDTAADGQFITERRDGKE